MNFQEIEDYSIPKLPNCLVYFLLYKKEVVYIGQTRNGIVRPLSHSDKKFDCIKILFVDYDKLDETEGYYIAKYNPKYNSKVTGYFCLNTAKYKIRKITHNNSFTLKSLTDACKDLKIDIKYLNGSSYICNKDIDLIVSSLYSGDVHG